MPDSNASATTTVLTRWPTTGLCKGCRSEMRACALAGVAYAPYEVATVYFLPRLHFDSRQVGIAGEVVEAVVDFNQVSIKSLP